VFVTRNNITDELQFVVKEINHGNSYHVERYTQEPLNLQVQSYLDQGFPQSYYPLIASGLFLRKNSVRVNRAFDYWYIEQTKWSIQDQLSLPFIIWKYNLSIALIQNFSIWKGPFHRHVGHISPSLSMFWVVVGICFFLITTFVCCKKKRI
jgi:hypothetical protein